MRHSPRTALTSCSAPLPPGKKYVGVYFLNKETIYVVVDSKGNGQVVFEEACNYLGLLDTELFGLALNVDREYLFIDHNLKISKNAPRTWKTHGTGVAENGKPLLQLHFRVKYYVDCHLLISDKAARHQYYLQLRENVLSYNQSLSKERAFLLAAFALQADLGNYSAKKHREKYFEINDYFPAWIANKIGELYIIRNIPSLHKDNAGLSRGECEVGYITEASDAAAPHHLHFYKMRRKKGKAWSLVWLGIRDSGIHMYEHQEVENNIKNHLSTFLWCDIAKLHFEKKKFEILSEGSPEARRFTYYVQNEDLAQNLLWMCRTTHQFHMANQNRVQELKKLELEGGKPYRETYIYTDSLDQAWEQRQTSTMRKVSVRKDSNSSINGQKNCSLEKSLPRGVQKSESEQQVYSMNHKSAHADEVNLLNSRPQRHSMEVLPTANGILGNSEIKFRCQSISCFSDSSLVSSPIFGEDTGSCQSWSPARGSSFSTTPTSTLLSRNSCNSRTDSACSSLSVVSGLTVKASSMQLGGSQAESTVGTRDSRNTAKNKFNERTVNKSEEQSNNFIHKVCISTFVDNHVRTTSLVDTSASESSVHTQTAKQAKYKSVVYVSLSPSLTLHQTQNKSTSIQQVGGATNASLHYIPMNNNTSEIQSDSSSLPFRGNDHHHLALTSSSPKNHKSLCHSQTASQKHFRHYFSNVQNSATFSPYSRTATRIGVSSLSRDQRMPLTLFVGGRKYSGSEPNLYNATLHYKSTTSVPLGCELTDSSSDLFRGLPNSCSEICLSAIGQIIPDDSTETSSCDFENPSLNLHQSSSLLNLSDQEDCTDFPCIPPPPAYRNMSDDSCSSDEFNDADNLPIPEIDGYSEISSSCPTEESKSPPESFPETSSDSSKYPHDLQLNLTPTPDVLDLQQLRQKSKDLDLPLISALCNDRSLLMLPKTVPTCSRQRHLGRKDMVRFSRSYESSVPNGISDDLTSTVTCRPTSWHLDSAHLSWSDPQVNCETTSRGSMMCNGSIHTKQSLPPTILTSFGRSPEKHSISGREGTSTSTSYRMDRNQMIPMKLLSGTIGNGRIHQKGSSS